MSALQVLVVSLLIVIGATEGAQLSRRAFENWRALRGFGRNSVQNTPPEMCAKALDIGIVMDRRLRSNNLTDWNSIKKFVENLIDNKFDVSDDMTHIGVISFDETSAEVLLNFKQGTKSGIIKQQMTTWRAGAEAKENGPVEIVSALRLALTNLFPSGRGYKEDQVLVLMTDGRYGVKDSAKLLKNPKEKAVNRVIVVGIGKADPVELWQLSLDPKDVLYLPGDNPEDIEPVAESVKKLACSNSNRTP